MLSDLLVVVGDEMRSFVLHSLDSVMFFNLIAMATLTGRGYVHQNFRYGKQ